MSSPFKPNSSTSALNRPFKSPLKRALPSSPASSSTKTGTKPCAKQTPSRNDDKKSPSRDSASSPATSSGSESESEFTNEEAEAETEESPTKKPRVSDAVLRREFVSLQSSLRKSTERLSTMRQAVTIASQPENDEELAELISKWRGVAQQCADMLYEKVREKVNRMGGVGVFKEREREKSERWKVEASDGFGEESESEDGEEMDSEERDERRRRRDEAREMRDERMREREDEGQGESGGWLKVLENADESTRLILDEPTAINSNRHIQAMNGHANGVNGLGDIHSPSVSLPLRPPPSSSSQQPQDHIRALQDLIAKRDRVEEELKALSDVLKSHNVTMQTSLTTFDGFPRSDIDVAQIRTTRSRIIYLSNDFKSLSSQIEAGLHEHHARIQAGDVSSIPAMSGPSTSVSRDERFPDGPDLSAPLEVAASTTPTPFARINSVAEHSPSEDAGFVVGDEVLQWDEITRRTNERMKAVAEVTGRHVGGEFSVTVRRRVDGDWRERKLTIRPRRNWGGQGVLGCLLVPI